MVKSSFNIYLVSLKQDVGRRDVLSSQFHQSFSTFNVIDAVDGNILDTQTYFRYLSSYYLRTRKIISPSELGCTFSHIKALKTFLASSASYALIFEDDVVGSDELLQQAQSLINEIPDNSVLLLGCQDGLRNTMWQYGKRFSGKNVYKMFKLSHKYVHRSCAYIVTRNSAQAILNRMNHPALADEWAYLLKDDVDMYFVKLFAHPVNLENSLLEADRALFYTKRSVSRLWDLKVYIRYMTAIFSVVIAFIVGNKKI
jgi:glycosyl transferase family 25